MTSYANDSLLYRAFLEGEGDAERAIFARFFKPVCIYAARIAGETIATEDIVIESFQKTWERRMNLPTIVDFRRFLYRIVSNACLTNNRLRRIHAGAHAQLHYLQQQDNQEMEPDESEMLRAELLQEIYLEIEGLPDRCREVFKAIFVEGLSTEAIAGRMGLEVQTVRSQKARAISLIRTRLLRRGQFIAIFLLYELLKG